ncbi:chemotaxis protein CheW [Tabrizicola sp. M-4]|uniref:chemotaxis protein CheW n=1 Tax=Tabrizicola sp. M-4 TaxID=3055847 RepID=UPI003DA97C8B
MQASETSHDANPQSLLTFGIAGECFAIPVALIHEVIDPLPVTPVPNAAEHAPGLINVRGIVTPVLDIRRKLRMPQRSQQSDGGRLIVLELPVEEVVTRVALAADTVIGVVDADGLTLDAVPELGARWPKAYVRGVAQLDDRLVVLLNTETLFSPDENATQTS